MNATPRVAIIDFGMGNIFSVCRGCEHAGLLPMVTFQRDEIEKCQGLILPGVGAFGDAMDSLRRNDLVSYIRDYAASGKPVMGICLGIQLLMSESQEFGRHEGLGLIKGTVTRLPETKIHGRTVKVPHVGWSQVFPVSDHADGMGWKQTLLEGISSGDYFYFVHSYFPCPEASSVVLSTSHYGETSFCSSLRDRNVTAFQYHPERSGRKGLQIYTNFASSIVNTSGGA